MKNSITFLLLLSFIYSPVIGQSPFSFEVDSLILRGIDQTFYSEFDSAMATFQKIINQHPDHIVGYFYQAATLQSEMMDYETDLWEHEFYKLIDKATQVGKQQIESGNDNPWTYFYLGNTLSYKGLYQAKSGSLIPGFISAKKGLGYLKKAVKKDSALYDSFLSLGSYKYWSGRFYKYLKWLPWIRDERDKGVRMVKSAVDRGTFSYWVGINTLGWIEYDRKNLHEALNLFQEGLAKYPGSRFFQWGVADSYFKLRDFTKALENYNELLESIQNGLLNNGYNEAECRIKLVISNFVLGQYEEALKHCEAVLGRQVEENIGGRLKKHYQITEKYRKKCLKELKNIRAILD